MRRDGLECGCIPKILGYESIDCNITTEDIKMRVETITRMIYADPEYSNERKGQIEYKVRFAKIILNGYVTKSLPEGMTATHDCANLTTVRYLLKNIRQRRITLRQLSNNAKAGSDNTTVQSSSISGQSTDNNLSNSATVEENLINNYTMYLDQIASSEPTTSFEEVNTGPEIIHHYPQLEQEAPQQLTMPQTLQQPESETTGQISGTADFLHNTKSLNKDSNASENDNEDSKAKAVRRKVFEALVENITSSEKSEEPEKQTVAPAKKLKTEVKKETFKQSVGKIVSHHYRSGVPFMKVEWLGYKDLTTTEPLTGILDAKEQLRKYLLGIGAKARSCLLQKEPELSKCFK